MAESDNDLALAERERKADLLTPAPAARGDLDVLLDAPVGGGVQLFGTSDPLEALDRAEALVQRMQRIVEKDRARFIARIPTPGGGVKDYPKVDWWTAMGFALNLIPRLTGEVVTVRDGDFLATVEVWQVDKGILVTRAEGFCSMSETIGRANTVRWGDEYAARAMAQTRAIGRAFRGPLGGLAALAGLETTPAEEMTGVHDSKASASRPAPKSAPAAQQAAPEGTDEGHGDAYEPEEAAPAPRPPDTAALIGDKDDVVQPDRIKEGTILVGQAEFTDKGWLRISHVNCVFKMSKSSRDAAEVPFPAWLVGGMWVEAKVTKTVAGKAVGFLASITHVTAPGA